MSGGAEGHIGADRDLIANEGFSIIYQHQIEIGIEVFSDMHMVSVVHMYRRFKEVLTATAQKVSRDLLSAYILPGMGIVVLEDHFLTVIPLLLELSFLLDIDGIGMAMFIEQHTIIDSVT